jgi:tight adherence protein C
VTVSLLLLPALLCAVAAGYLALSELVGVGRGRAALARAASYGRVQADPQAARPERGRRELPFVHALARATLKLAPGRESGKTAVQLHRAGFGRVRPEMFLALKSALALAGIAFGVLLGAAAGKPASAVMLALAVGAAGFLLPDVVLRTRTRSRREAILGELPNALDLLAVIVEAGLGLDAALARYAQTATGPLGEEMALLVTELRVGSARAEVLKRFAERVPAPETKAFVRAVVHADQLGTSLSGALRTQAQEVRYRRQAVAEERANKAPVKMLFPTVFCIFPVLFVVVLGPVLLNLVRSL